MNWWKRKLTQLFTHEDYEEDVQDEFVEKFEPDSTIKANNEKPLIQSEQLDDGEAIHLRAEKSIIFDQMRTSQNGASYMYSDEKIYDVEQPRISELLANRGNQIKTERIIRSQRIETIETTPANRMTKKSEQVLSDLKEPLPKPTLQKKRFTPSRVPSPVYGFAKPSVLKSLLEQRQEESQPSQDAKENVDKKEISFFNESIQKLETQQTNISREIPISSNSVEVSQTTILSKEQQAINTVDQLSKEQETPAREEEQVIRSESNPALNREGSKIPFNVIMLKSDKEKWHVKATSSFNADKEQFTKEIAATNEQVLENEVASFSEYEKNMEQPNSQHQYEQLETSHSKLNNKILENQTPIEENAPVLTSEITNVDQRLDSSGYIKPSIQLLEPPEGKIEDTEWMLSQAEKLVEALSYFQVSANVESILQGPAVTQFEITVSQGTKVSKIRNLADDLKLALAAKDIRIQAPIPGKSSIGIEIPNRKSRAVRLSEVTRSEVFQQSDSPLEAALGLDLTGKPVTIDLRKMPHGLIAGATGSGKSVCINSILVSLLYKAAPHELKLMLIDPKVVELAPFNHIPHLVSPVITDVKAATAALKWAVEEMERRYQLFAEVGVRDLPRYNSVAESKKQYSLKLPYILIVIDELADLMMMAPADVEEAICRIAQKARACGIHLIVATQRPSVDVITGLIKSNIPTRIAFAVSSQIDSRTILDSQGAERLLGRGDMLYLGNGMSDAIRIQGTFVTDDEIETIIEHVRGQGKPDYIFDQEELLKKTEISEGQDDLFEDVCRFVYEQGSASTSLIQRKYHIGYNRAARLVDMLEQNGFISEQRGSKARDVYITESDLVSLFES